jgi:hypothetical protein
VADGVELGVGVAEGVGLAVGVGVEVGAWTVWLTVPEALGR